MAKILIVDDEKDLANILCSIVKFTTKKARGWIDVGGTRMNKG